MGHLIVVTEARSLCEEGMTIRQRPVQYSLVNIVKTIAFPSGFGVN